MSAAPLQRHRATFLPRPPPAAQGKLSLPRALRRIVPRLPRRADVLNGPKLTARYDFTPDDGAEVALEATFDGDTATGTWIAREKSSGNQAASGTWSVKWT